MDLKNGIPEIKKRDKNSKTRYEIISQMLNDYKQEDHFQDYRQIFINTFPGKHTIIASHDSENNKNYKRIIHFNRYLSDQNSLILEELNKQGVGIYMCVNETNGKSIKDEDIIRIRSVFAAFDDPIDGLTVKNINEKYDPSMIIDKTFDFYSPTGRYLIFWKVKDFSLDAFSNMQQAIAYNLNSNPHVTDLSVSVPVPGFVNTKGEPFLTEIISMGDDDDKFYSLQELSVMFKFH